MNEEQELLDMMNQLDNAEDESDLTLNEVWHKLKNYLQRKVKDA